jgi:leader peptidase (prepilin peptidase)/N-methyltransferase
MTTEAWQILYKILFVAGIVVLGLIIGSFMGAGIWRMRKVKSIVKGRSKCPKCKHQLAWFDLVPVFSYLFLGGKCRYCKKPISGYYPFIEAINGLVYGVIGWMAFTQSSRFIPYLSGVDWLVVAVFGIAVLAIFSILIYLATYDLWFLEVPELPLKILYGEVALYLAGSGWLIYRGIGGIPTLPMTQYNWGDFSLTLSPTLLLANVAIGGVFMFLFFFLLNKITKNRGMGWGDVVFAPVVGLLLGVLPGVFALFASFILGAIISTSWALAKYKKIKGVIVPYLPFLCLVTALVFLWQPAIMKMVIGYVFGV